MIEYLPEKDIYFYKLEENDDLKTFILDIINNINPSKNENYGSYLRNDKHLCCVSNSELKKAILLKNSDLFELYTRFANKVMHISTYHFLSCYILNDKHCLDLYKLNSGLFSVSSFNEGNILKTGDIFNLDGRFSPFTIDLDELNTKSILDNPDLFIISNIYIDDNDKLRVIGNIINDDLGGSVYVSFLCSISDGCKILKKCKLNECSSTNKFVKSIIIYNKLYDSLSDEEKLKYEIREDVI